MSFAAFLPFFVTYTLHKAFFPLEVVAVITAVPVFLALILPFLTETTDFFEVFHLILSVEEDGVITLLSCKASPLAIYTFFLFSFIFLAGTLTVILHETLFKPSAVIAVILAVPFLTAFTTPFCVTVATEVLLLFQIIVLLGASAGRIYAFNVTFLPLSSVTDVLSSVISFTAFVLPVFLIRLKKN